MESMRVPVKVAQHMREMLATINAPVTGLVINNRTQTSERYRYYGRKYYRYGYRYNYGYGYYSDKEAEKSGIKVPLWKQMIIGQKIPGGKNLFLH